MPNLNLLLLCVQLSQQSAVHEEHLDKCAKLFEDIAYERNFIPSSIERELNQRYSTLCKVQKEKLILKQINISVQKKYTNEWRLRLSGRCRKSGKIVTQSYPYEYLDKPRQVVSIFYPYNLKTGNLEPVNSLENRCHAIAKLAENFQIATGVWTYDISKIVLRSPRAPEATLFPLDSMKLFPGKDGKSFTVLDSKVGSKKLRYLINEYNQLDVMAEYY